METMKRNVEVTDGTKMDGDGKHCEKMDGKVSEMCKMILTGFITGT